MFGRKKKEKAPKKVRFKTLRDAYALTKRHYSLVLLRCFLVFLPIWAIGIGIGALFDKSGYAAFATFPLATLGGFYYFTRLASSAAYASIEGEAGAGASILMAIRKGWTVTPAVTVNKAQDMVHRAVGRPGIVLVGEGGSSVKNLLQDERKKLERYAPGVPIFELTIGDLDGQVSIRKLEKRMKRLPKKLNKVQLRELRARLKTVGGITNQIPKGPMPKNFKMPKPR